MKRLLVAVLLAMALLASCGSSSPTAASDSVDGAKASSATEAATTGQPVETAGAEPDDDEPTVNDAFLSPLGEALGFDPGDRTAANNEYVRSAEELVRKCMLNAGFEYVPADSGFAPSFERRLELESTLSEERFVREYGYGIATLFELNFEREGVMTLVEQLLGPAPTEERSAAEQEAYELALSGSTIQGIDPDEVQGDALNTALSWGKDGSCRRTGYDTAENPQGEIFEGLQSLLGDELDAMNDRFESDTRVRDERQDWQRCLGQAGFAYETAQEIRDEVTAATNDIANRFSQSPQALALFAQALSANISNMDRPERFDFLESIGAMEGLSMVPELQIELDDLIEFELEVAGVSFDCSDRVLLREVRYELEQDFVETHADQLALIVNGDA